jgi:hypothetical protein
MSNCPAERIAAAREGIEAQGGRWGRPCRMGRDEVARAAAMRAERGQLEARLPPIDRTAAWFP